MYSLFICIAWGQFLDALISKVIIIINYANGVPAWNIEK